MSHLNSPAYFWLASVLTTYGDKLGPASMVTISDRIAALEAGAGGVVPARKKLRATNVLDMDDADWRDYGWNLCVDAMLAAAPKASEACADCVPGRGAGGPMMPRRCAKHSTTPQADPAPPVEIRGCTIASIAGEQPTGVTITSDPAPPVAQRGDGNWVVPPALMDEINADAATWKQRAEAMAGLLRFYGDAKNYLSAEYANGNGYHASEIDRDGGEQARALLRDGLAAQEGAG